MLSISCFYIYTFSFVCVIVCVWVVLLCNKFSYLDKE